MTPPARLALFDFDGTLVRGNTLHFLVGQRIRRPSHSARILAWSALRKSRLIGSRRFKEAVLSSLRGWDEASVSALGRTLHAERVQPALRGEGLKVMEALRRDGCQVVLVTGAFDFMVEPFRRDAGIHDVLCCRPERDESGALTGRIAGPELLGPEKRQAVRGHFRGLEVDWDASSAFTDDLRDLPILEMVGRRYLVVGSRRTSPGPPGVRSVVW